jgi:hypothetical protein
MKTLPNFFKCIILISTVFTHVYTQNNVQLHKSGPTKNPVIFRDYSKADGVELKLSKVEKNYYEIKVFAPENDSAVCDCPGWSSRPISGMKLFAIQLDEPGQCEDTIQISTEGNGLVIYPGDSLALWINKAPQIFKNVKSFPDSDKYYVEGCNDPYSGEFPIYEMSGKIDTIDITFSLKQKCVFGALKRKAKLFRKRGLTIRLVINATNGFPIISKVE